MCRIAGIIQPSLLTAEIENMVTEMCNLQKHGGPDDGGIFTAPGEHLVLGNRRLSLLDLTAGGHQPMHYGERFSITYNGELYNFKDLKEELKAAGRQFVNETDTEVILAAFATWHTQSFSRLNGMFAFALWDNKEKALYLVRDAAGIKPLYWSAHGGGLAFASEMRAFAPVPYLQEKNNKIPIFQMAYGYIPEPVTVLAHVQPVPKGCYLKYDTEISLCSIISFAFFSFSNKITDQAKAENITRSVTEDAVKRQMIADAQVGVFLSGGIDSAIIANLARNYGKNNLHTLSIWFGEENYSEKKYQDIVAKQLNSTHHSFKLCEADFHEHFPEILRAMDMPSCDGINTWFISKYAVQAGLKGVLSGIGADELFGGYPSFRRMKVASFLQSLPTYSFRPIEKRLKKLNRISYLRLSGIRGLYLFLRGHFTPVQIAEQTGAYEKEVWSILADMPASPVFKGLGSKNTAGWMEFNLYMQDQLLRDADVMSMAHGLEIRVPFLDNEVIQDVYAMSENVRFGTFPKQLLVNSFKEILPEDIWNRPKMGFSFPFAEWLRKSIYVRQLEGSPNPYTRQACIDFLNGNLHWSRIMSLIVLREKC